MLSGTHGRGFEICDFGCDSLQLYEVCLGPHCFPGNRLIATDRHTCKVQVARIDGGQPGRLPEVSERDFMMGMKMPPALAVVEGMAGAIRPSAKARPYANPSVLLPKALTKSVATRSPRPVFSKPCQHNKKLVSHEQPMVWPVFISLLLHLLLTQSTLLTTTHHQLAANLASQRLQELLAPPGPSSIALPACRIHPLLSTACSPPLPLPCPGPPFPRPPFRLPHPAGLQGSQPAGTPALTTCNTHTASCQQADCSPVVRYGVCSPLKSLCTLAC